MARLQGPQRETWLKSWSAAGLLVLGALLLLQATSPFALAVTGPAAVRPDHLDFPPALRGHSVAYDSQSDRFVVFGGATQTSLINPFWPTLDQTWVFDARNASWTLMHPEVSPGPRWGAAMVYDSESDRVILFGGEANLSSPALNDTWVFDLERDNWTQMAPSSAPPARGWEAMAYASAHDRTILFGGSHSLLFNDTWSYDFNNNTWARVPTPDAPRRLETTNMAYDPLADRIVLFGGRDGSFVGGQETGTNETWLFDPTNGTWTLAPPGRHPQARWSHEMAFDAAAGRVVLAGGFNGTGAGGATYNFVDTWEFDTMALTWTPTFPNHTYTGPLGGEMSYWGAGGVLVFFGGGSAYAFDRGAVGWEPWRWPEAPQTLDAGASLGSIELQWIPGNGSQDALLQRFRVYRGLDPTNLSPIGNVSGLRYFHDDQSLVNGTTYYYAVAEENDVGEGPLSPIAVTVAIVPPAAQAPPPPVPSPVDGRVLAVGISTGLVIALGVALSTSRGNEAIASLAAVPLFTRLRRDELRNQVNRARIIDYLAENPGASFTQTMRALELSGGSCAYHLRVLERSGEIRRLVHGASARFYPEGFQVDERALPPLSAVQRQILEVALERSHVSFGQLAEHLKERGLQVTQKNQAYHLRVLVREKGFLETSREAGHTVYFVPEAERAGLRTRLVGDTAVMGAPDRERDGVATFGVPDGE